MNKRRIIILNFLGLFLLISAYVEAKIRTQVVRSSPSPERNVGIIPEARSVEDWARVRTQVKKKVEKRNRQLETSQNLPDKMEESHRETEEERVKSAYKVEKYAREMKRKIEQASPNEVTGENPDGTKWYQYSGRFDIFKNWIKRKMQELGLLDKWKGESLEELVQKYNKTNFELTFNKKSWSYFGKRSSNLQTTEFQFSLTNPEDNFEEYIQTRSRQLIWDSVNNREAEIVQNTVTDEMEWAGKYYGTPGKTEQGRQMLSSRQRIWDETRGTYSEVIQKNVYEGNFHMPVKTIRKVFESGYDEDGKYYERRYEITRENIEWVWVVSGDPVSGGSYETKSFTQTMIDYSTPDKKTVSYHEFTYSDDGVPESQLIVSRELGPGLDRTSVTVEKYLSYYSDGSLQNGLTLNMTGDFSDLDTAIKEGKTLQTLLNGEAKAQIETYLGRSLNLKDAQDLKIYASYLNKLLGLLNEKDLTKEEWELFWSKISWDSLGDTTGRKISLDFAEKKYNDKAFLAWEKELVAVYGKDEEGNLINYSSEIEKTYREFLPFGQAKEIEQIIRNEATPDVETRLKISFEYDENCRVIEQKTEAWEIGLNGKLNKHTVSIKENITYNGLGQEISYTEKEEEYDSQGNLIANRFSEVTNIIYNEDGLQSGYDMRTTVRGTDIHDGTQFEIVTETKVRDIEYNELDLRTQWKEITVDLSRSPALATERIYRVKGFDSFGRITEVEIFEHAYGSASDGTSINTERTITRKIRYNSLGQEEEVIETIVEKAKTTTSTIKYEYDQYGRLSREERLVEVSGQDGDVVLDYTYSIIRENFQYNEAGLVQSYSARIWNEASPDVEITQEVEIGYDEFGQVNYQKTETWENSSGDKALSKHTITIKENITYNELGLETGYSELEEEYDVSGNLVGNRFNEVSNITYNEDGLMTGYYMRTTVHGTDNHDGTEFEIVTETQVRNIEYNELGIRIRWEEVSVDLSRSPALTTERIYEVTAIDKFGRIIEITISEHSYGTASDGTSLDYTRTITRQITYNSLGQEEMVVEIVEEGAKTTTSTIYYEYDEYGRINYEERDIYVTGEEEGVELDYEYSIKRYDFEYNDAGLLQHYVMESWNESSPDLDVRQEVWFGYDSLGRIDYQKTEVWETGVREKRDKYGEPTGEMEEVNRHTISEKYDIQYNELGLETYYVTDTEVYEDGELTSDITETTYDIRYDYKGRIIEYWVHRVGTQKVTDEESERYGQMENIDVTIHTYNITYIDGLDLRKSWETFTTGTVDGQPFKDSWNYYEVLEFDRFGEVVDMHVEGDGVDDEENGGNGGTSQAQGSGNYGTGSSPQIGGNVQLPGGVQLGVRSQALHSKAPRGRVKALSRLNKVYTLSSRQRTRVYLMRRTKKKNTGEEEEEWVDYQPPREE